MDKKVKEVLEIWHNYFSDEEKQYSEFEDSDIEYFVGCMLYNHFKFKKALDTMKTIDLSYDFLSSCSDEYDEVKAIIESIEFDNDIDKLKFLQKYILESKAKYSKSELYLLNRLDYHVNAMAQRYEKGVDVKKIVFENPLTK